MNVFKKLNALNNSNVEKLYALKSYSIGNYLRK
jgi:hypothetical protein